MVSKKGIVPIPIPRMPTAAIVVRKQGCQNPKKGFFPIPILRKTFPNTHAFLFRNLECQKTKTGCFSFIFLAKHLPILMPTASPLLKTLEWGSDGDTLKHGSLMHR